MRTCFPITSLFLRLIKKCEATVKSKQRPVNLDLRTIKLPLPAYTSITHRITGVILFCGLAIVLYLLDASLSSEQDFNSFKSVMQHPLIKLIVWGLLSAFCYHLVAGIRHLIMDCGVGETLEGGKLGSKIVVAISAILIVLAGVWIW